MSTTRLTKIDLGNYLYDSKKFSKLIGSLIRIAIDYDNFFVSEFNHIVKYNIHNLISALNYVYYGGYSLSIEDGKLFMLSND